LRGIRFSPHRLSPYQVYPPIGFLSYRALCTIGNCALLPDPPRFLHLRVPCSLGCALMPTIFRLSRLSLVSSVVSLLSPNFKILLSRSFKKNFVVVFIQPLVNVFPLVIITILNCMAKKQIGYPSTGVAPSSKHFVLGSMFSFHPKFSLSSSHSLP